MYVKVFLQFYSGSLGNATFNVWSNIPGCFFETFCLIYDLSTINMILKSPYYGRILLRQPRSFFGNDSLGNNNSKNILHAKYLWISRQRKEVYKLYKETLRRRLMIICTKKRVTSSEET